PSFVPSSNLPIGTLFWRVRAVATGAHGERVAESAFTNPSAFRVSSSSAYIDPPIPMAPFQGMQVETRPVLEVRNSHTAGAATPLLYRFEIATNASFIGPVISAMVPENSMVSGGWIGHATQLRPADLEFGTTYYWRVQSVDPLAVTTS